MLLSNLQTSCHLPFNQSGLCLAALPVCSWYTAETVHFPAGSSHVFL